MGLKGERTGGTERVVDQSSLGSVCWAPSRALGVSLTLNRISFPVNTGTGKKRREMSLNNLKQSSFKKAKSCHTPGENPERSAADPKNHPKTLNVCEEKGEMGSKCMRSPFLWGCEWCETLWRPRRLLAVQMLGDFGPGRGDDIPWTSRRSSDS